MLNTITVMGRLVRDPELRRTGSGTPVASFTVAVDRDFGKNEAGEKETDFIDCVAWRGTGEFVAKYFTKGSMAIVTGSLQIRNWTDKEGNKRRNAEIIAGSVYFGDSKKSDQGNYTPQAANGALGNAADYPETMAKINQYQQQAQSAPQSDFAMLDDDDAHLPF